MKKAIWWIVGIVVVILIIVSMRGSNTETGPIKIGFIGPLTGDAAAYGEPVSNGIRLAEKQINASGGIAGRPVQVIYEDGKCDGPTAVSAAQKLINVDGVRFIIDGVCSGEVLATAPIIDKAKILAISPGATSPKISGVSKYIFRNAPSDAGRGVAIADMLAGSFKSAAVISEKTDYAQGISSTFISELQKKNVTLTANEMFSSDTTDFRSILTKIKQTKPDAILIDPQTPANLVRIAQQARALGITAQFFASEFNDPTVTAGGSAVEGMLIAVAPGLSSTSGKGKDFLDAYKAEFGKDASYPYYAGAAYDDMNLFASGITQNGNNSDKVRDYFLKINGYTGSIGTYSFDQNGDLAGISFVFQKIVGGKLINL